MRRDPRPPSAVEITAAFKLAMRRLATTVTIVTAGREGRRFGMTATAVTSVTAEPPTLLICVNRKASIHAIIVDSGRYCVNILATHHAGLVGPFGGLVEGEARFLHGGWSRDLDGTPYLDDAQASLFCAVRQSVDYGSHSILIGEVMSVLLSDAITPLLYQDGGLAASRLLDP
jgi:flavin reductase